MDRKELRLKIQEETYQLLRDNRRSTRFTDDELTWILGRCENSGPSHTPEGRAIIARIRGMLNREDRVTYAEHRAASKRLRKELR